MAILHLVFFVQIYARNSKKSHLRCRFFFKQTPHRICSSLRSVVWNNFSFYCCIHLPFLNMVCALHFHWISQMENIESQISTTVISISKTFTERIRSNTFGKLNLTSLLRIDIFWPMQARKSLVEGVWVNLIAYKAYNLIHYMFSSFYFPIVAPNNNKKTRSFIAI